MNEILDVYAGIAARLAGVPCVWHVRADVSTWPSPLRKVLPRIVAALASEIVVVSDSVRREVFLEQGIETPKVSVIHDAGPDPAVFHVGIDGASVRRSSACQTTGSSLCWYRSWWSSRATRCWSRAIPQVLDTFPQTRFAIVGPTSTARTIADTRSGSGACRPSWVSVMPCPSWATAMTFPQIMAAADIVTHCSTHPDPFPGVVLQGMALGKAVIATNLGGATEQIDDGVSGALVPPGDPAALADAICSLLEDPTSGLRWDERR